MATESPTNCRGAAAPAERPHNPWREAVQERVVRQIRMLRARRRELETGLRPLLHGHAGGNPDTAKERPTNYRASSRPYQQVPIRVRTGSQAWSDHLSRRAHAPL
jgi:hypothetical protein